MSRLPNAEGAIVEEHKLTGYLLSFSHLAGRSKAGFFQQVGFQPQSWQQLRAALLRHARENTFTRSENTPFGTKYIVEGPLPTPDGRNRKVRSVWFVEAGEKWPRFVTAYPLRGERS